MDEYELHIDFPEDTETEIISNLMQDPEDNPYVY